MSLIKNQFADFEKRSLRASAAVQEELKCAVSIHPGRNPEAPFEIMRIFQEAGGKADKTIMSHLESNYTIMFPSFS